MRLQTDPAVMYGVSRNFTGKLTKKHLKTDTPYNTYTRSGLPPTPICMPQEKSILAALHPENSKSLYFVAKGVSPKEGHSFSSTLDEHNRAVVSYRKKVAEYLKQQQIADSSQDELIEAENEAQNNNTGVSQDRNKNSSDKAKVASKTKSDDSKSDNNKNVFKSDGKTADSKSTEKKDNKTAVEKSKTNDKNANNNNAKTQTVKETSDKKENNANKENKAKGQNSQNSKENKEVKAKEDKANDKVTKAEEQKSDDPSNNATVKGDNSTQVSIKEKSLKQNKRVVSSKTNNNETDRIAKIRQIQKDAFKKETPVKVESKKNEILIKVD